MSYATSCFPKSNPVSGVMDLTESKEPLSAAMYVGTILQGTLGYPVHCAFAAISELYLSLNWIFHKYKHWHLERKIHNLGTFSDLQIEEIKNRRLEKLQLRITGVWTKQSPS